MKIIGWTWYGNPDYQEMYPIGAETNCDWDRTEVIAVIANELRKKGYRFTGDYHQNGDYGVPLFDNGMVATFTQRTWGQIMYLAYPEDKYKEQGYEYLKWAWIQPEGEELIIPTENTY